MAQTYSQSRTIFNRSVRNDINMRVFEAVACGSLLVTNDLRDNGQDELFRDGTHIATYRSAEELVEKIDFYLSHESERERIAATGQTEAHSRHSYRLRMLSILTAFGWKPNQTTIATGSVAERDDSTQDRDMGYFEHARPELLERIPLTARRVLDIGCGGGRLGESLKARQPVHVTGVDMVETAANAARTRLDEVFVGDIERIDFPSGSFDAVICGDVLEHLRDPSAFLLHRLRGWLKPDGVLITSIPNVRHLSVIQALLAGNWTYESAGLLDRDHFAVLHASRDREASVFGPASRFAISGIIPGPGYADWVQRGRVGEVGVAGLSISGLSQAMKLEEFYVYQYLVTAAPAKRTRESLTSIVILTHNQLEFTRLCVESIRHYTDAPYELIFVDNASTDGTGDYLDSISGALIIRNTTNRGFPAAANQGIRAANGRQVLLLNNDTIVTTGWLTRLLNAFEADPHIGLAGPCSNCVGSDQQVPANYNDLSNLDGFAWDWARQNLGKLLDTDRLIGFCLLIRREVINRIGLLDEDFGLGCFEDDDYCKRALHAGFRAVIARDAFVHHFGGQTFLGIGVDYAALLQSNKDLFLKKWDKRSAGGHDPPSPVKNSKMSQPRFSESIAALLTACDCPGGPCDFLFA